MNGGITPHLIIYFYILSCFIQGEVVRGEQFDRLELENKLIKQEVTQLTDEIGFLSSKISSYRVCYQFKVVDLSEIIRN